MIEKRPGEANRERVGESEDWEETVRFLLRPPGLQYIRELKDTLERDPDYLQFHAGSVAVRINELLARSRSGMSGVSENNVEGIVREAIRKSRPVP
ncbi:MAG: hypothetical protein HRF44_12650 [Ignavibacterium sp.]